MRPSPPAFTVLLRDTQGDRDLRKEVWLGTGWHRDSRAVFWSVWNLVRKGPRAQVDPIRRGPSLSYI